MIQRAEQGEELFKANVVKIFVSLKLNANALFDPVGVGPDADAVNKGFSAVDIVQALDHFQRGGLAGSVRAEDTEDLALLYREGHAVHSKEFFRFVIRQGVLLLQVTDFDDGHGGSSPAALLCDDDNLTCPLNTRLRRSAIAFPVPTVLSLL